MAITLLGPPRPSKPGPIDPTLKEAAQVYFYSDAPPVAEEIENTTNKVNGEDDPQAEISKHVDVFTQWLQQILGSVGDEICWWCNPYCMAKEKRRAGEIQEDLTIKTGPTALSLRRWNRDRMAISYEQDRQG